MANLCSICVTALLVLQSAFVEESRGGMQGDPMAIAEAEAMVQTMGGIEIWARLKQVEFVHEWWPWYRLDSYIETEILDLTGPRSWVEMKSEIYHRIRAYSPEHNYWSLMDGDLTFGDEKSYKNAMERAPYSIYRIARAIALGDSTYQVEFGQGDIPRSRRLEFLDEEGNLGGWIILNARSEPLVWATTQYRYTFGPMARYGNLRVPKWAVYENGTTMYEMISLRGSDQRPDLTLFAPPSGDE